VSLRPITFVAGFLFLAWLVAGAALSAEPRPPGWQQMRYPFSGDYPKKLCEAIYRQNHDPEYLPPKAEPGQAIAWCPSVAEIIEKYTGIKRREGAQIYYLVDPGVIVVEGDAAWRSFIIKLHTELGMPLYRR